MNANLKTGNVLEGYFTESPEITTSSPGRIPRIDLEKKEND